jgi:hypothetical protein
MVVQVTIGSWIDRGGEKGMPVKELSPQCRGWLTWCTHLNDCFIFSLHKLDNWGTRQRIWLWWHGESKEFFSYHHPHDVITFKASACRKNFYRKNHLISVFKTQEVFLIKFQIS